MKKTAVIFFGLFSYTVTSLAGVKPVSHETVMMKKEVPMQCRYVPKTTGHKLRWNCRCNQDIQPYHSWKKMCGVPK